MHFYLVSTSFVLDATSVQVSYTKLCLSIILAGFFLHVSEPTGSRKGHEQLGRQLPFGGEMCPSSQGK